MQLIIREYLSMLKESGEIDSLLGDLLLSMNILPISRAQIGVRQHGVDLAAIGPDIDNKNVEKVFLFTIKAGHIDRNNWDTKKQDVRPSLNEIIDVYIPKHLDDQHRQLSKKIVVCCNGELKQEVEQNWVGYKEQNIKEGIEFDFWGADKLSLYVSKYFIDEYLFPESARKKIRRSLAFIGLPDYELSHFYALVDEILFDRKLPKSKGHSQERKRLKAIRMVHLALRLLSTWGEEEGNSKPGFLAAEYTLLRVWDWMRLMNLLNNKKTFKEFYHIYLTYQKIAANYINKILKHCYTRDGLFGWGPEAEVVEYPIRVFEIIGILSTFGLSHFFEYLATQNNNRKQDILSVADALVNVIQNNPATNLPCFDGHSIDICLGLMLLSLTGNRETAAYWIQDLTGKICFAFQLGKHFPIATDSYDDLIALEIDQAATKEELTSYSTIFPILAQWCAKLGLKETYAFLLESVKKVFPHSSMQIWYPDEKTDNVLYKQNASRTGTTVVIEFPRTIDEIRKQMQDVWEHVIAPEHISCLSKKGFPIIGLIASRHFRTPIIPVFWQSRKQLNQLKKN